MRPKQRWWLTLVLTILMPLGGCDKSGQSSRASLSDSSRFMDLWNTYTHCFRSEDLDAMRTDAQRLGLAVNTTGSTEDSIDPESIEPVPLGPTIRLSADPVAMAASCALRTGQTAREMGRLNVAREMFHSVVANFQQPRYQYYVAQARRGLEQLDAASHASLSGLTL
ncbi:MAG TPA: hypothetical protein VEM37_01890 [Nitrospiraceae bacterium]|nr:hypothetical protein [Nitrospiraceae bacterium]